VSKEPKGKTFAEIVREVEDQPVVPVADRTGVVDPSGRRWHQHVARITPARALELASQGATVAWDPCGCGGYCPFDWFGVDDVAALVASGKPSIRAKKNTWGNLSEWITSDGDVLVVAELSVRWGALIDG
jgi:hypothetical protein